MGCSGANIKIDKVEKIIHNDDALKRLKEQHGSQKFLRHPDISAIIKDKELIILARERNFKQFIQHPKVIAIANNKELLKLFIDYDIEEAIDQAL